MADEEDTTAANAEAQAIEQATEELATEEVEAQLQDVVSSPFSRVPKQNTDRTLSSEGRFCPDCRTPINEGTVAGLQPQVVLSSHQQVARTALRWHARP